MAVYVDPLFSGVATDAQARRVGARNDNRWCHLFADSSDELRAFAARIGMKPQWIQHAGTVREHFDLTPGRRAAAVRLGAIETDRRTLGQRILAARRAIPLPEKQQSRSDK